jgi:hypothetical protein
MVPQIRPLRSSQESGEKKRCYIAGVSTGTRKQAGNKFGGFNPIRIVERGKAYNQVSPGITVCDGKDVDAVQEVGPGYDSPTPQ